MATNNNNNQSVPGYYPQGSFSGVVQDGVSVDENLQNVLQRLATTLLSYSKSWRGKDRDIIVKLCKMLENANVTYSENSLALLDPAQAEEISNLLTYVDENAQMQKFITANEAREPEKLTGAIKGFVENAHTTEKVFDDVVASLRSLVAEKEQQNNASRAEVEDLRDKLATAEKMITEQEADKVKLSGIIDSYLMEINNRNQEVEGLIKERDELQKRLDALLNPTTALQDATVKDARIAELEEQIKVLNMQILGIKRENDRLKTENKALSETNAGLQGRAVPVPASRLLPLVKRAGWFALGAGFGLLVAFTGDKLADNIQILNLKNDVKTVQAENDELKKYENLFNEIKEVLVENGYNVPDESVPDEVDKVLDANKVLQEAYDNMQTCDHEDTVESYRTILEYLSQLGVNIEKTEDLDPEMKALVDEVLETFDALNKAEAKVKEQESTIADQAEEIEDLKKRPSGGGGISASKYNQVVAERDDAIARADDLANKLEEALDRIDELENGGGSSTPSNPGNNNPTTPSTGVESPGSENQETPTAPPENDTNQNVSAGNQEENQNDPNTSTGSNPQGDSEIATGNDKEGTSNDSGSNTGTGSGTDEKSAEEKDADRGR